ncbi:MAG TPA: hypothetical protein VGV60_14710 [Candidatus Polarisedimenticolia bacterium]|jgi:hypothetical protein|nr:hypothetical protein [Candidatus Polarisedimenticolia bacterium]
MRNHPEVQVIETAYGPLDRAASLNRRMARGGALLRATLDVRWDDPGAVQVLTGVEAALVAFSPSFRWHQCRGPHAYHVFARDRPPVPVAAGGHTDGQGSRDMPFDAGLALAHLIEHAVIDFESAITHERRISGVTGARLRPPGRYDVMVECPEPAVGRLCLAMAIVSLTGAADSHPPGRREQDLLATARATYRHPGQVWTPPGLARVLGWPIARAEDALSSLRDLGYLAPLPSTMNFSGVPCYRVAT